MPSAAVATVGEDYSTDFLIQLNTWEGGLKSSRDWRENPEPLELARLPRDITRKIQKLLKLLAAFASSREKSGSS
jgi:hypothetical protein